MPSSVPASQAINKPSHQIIKPLKFVVPSGKEMKADIKGNNKELENQLSVLKRKYEMLQIKDDMQKEKNKALTKSYRMLKNKYNALTEQQG